MKYSDINIFKGLNENEIERILKSTKVEIKSFAKDEYVFRVGEVSSDFYYLIEGEIIVNQIDNYGNRFIFQKIEEKTGFGEVYAFLNEPFDFDGICERDSKVLIIKDFKKLFENCDNKIFFNNYIEFISKKCLNLSRKNQITSKKTLRQKICKFILENEESGNLTLSMNREDLADYISTTRPSLSRELSKMASEDIIEIDGKDIKILDIEKIRNEI